MAIHFLLGGLDEDEQVERVAEQLGVDEDEVREAFDRLPKASS